jgi:hypothetical protein
VSALLSSATQHVFCREFDAASGELDLWPEATRAKTKADFAEFVKTYNSALAAQKLHSRDKK